MHHNTALPYQAEYKLGETRGFIIGVFMGVRPGEESLPVRGLKFLNCEIQVCRFWCILTVIKSLVLVDD